jgi:hypothetical protein
MNPTLETKLVGRAVLCAPGCRLQPNGAHGVTRPTKTKP